MNYSILLTLVRGLKWLLPFPLMNADVNLSPYPKEALPPRLMSEAKAFHMQRDEKFTKLYLLKWSTSKRQTPPCGS